MAVASTALIVAASCHRPAPAPGNDGTWIAALGSRTFMVLQIQAVGSTFTGTLSHPSKFHTSDGVRFSGIASEPVTETIVAATVESDGLHVTTRTPKEPADETAFLLTQTGDAATLAILGIPIDIAIPFTRYRGDDLPAVATDWDAAATYSTDARPQGRVVGTVDFFGVRRVSMDAIRGALRITEGQTIGVERTEQEEAADAERRLAAIPGVHAATLDWVCCSKGRVALFVGISETYAPANDFRASPTGAIRLPKALRDLVDEHDAAIMRAVLRGDNAEDDSPGRALSHDPAARNLEEQFIEASARDLAVIRDVVRRSADAGDRAAAADLLGYAPDKIAVVPDLAFAVGDPSDRVRNNALRALAVMAQAGVPLQRAHVAPQAFVRLLNSPVWTDRNKALFLLERLSTTRDDRLFAALRAGALPALVEMARWKSPDHGEPAFMLLGRMAGFTDDDLRAAWMRGNRGPVIDAALAGGH